MREEREEQARAHGPARPVRAGLRHPRRAWKALGRRALIAAAIVGALAIVVAAAAWAFPIFRVTQFDVRGGEQISSEQAAEASGVSRGENLLRVDTRAAASGVAALDWAETVTVSRSFPHTLRVDITEHEPLAFLPAAQGGAPRLVDEKGRIFAVADPPPGAIEITGADEAKEQVLGDAAEVIAAVPAGARELVKNLEIKGPYALALNLQDGRTVFWGANEDNRAKAQAMETVLKMEGRNWNISNPELVSEHP